MTRYRSGSLAWIAAIGLGVSVAGCGGGDERRADTTRVGQIASDSAALRGSFPGIDWDKVVESAEKDYTYDPSPQRPSVASNPAEFDEKEDPGVNPDIKLARATLKAGATPYGKIIGRIVSTEELKKLKIQKDTNYLWHAEGSTDIYTVPQKEPSKGKKVKIGGKFTDANPDHGSSTHLVRAEESRLVGTKTVVSFAFGICTDDCPTGHCGLQ